MATIIANPNLGAKGGKKLTEAQKKKRAETRAFNKANPKPARGKRPAKGSAEAKAVGERLAASRKKKKDETDKASGADAKVELPEFGSEKLLTPRWFIAGPNKNGKYNLVSPTSERRNLSTRKGMNSLEMIIKKGLKHSVVINKDIKVKLADFSKADQARIHKHFAEISAQSGKTPTDKSAFNKSKAKERGRPETLPKNIAANKRKRKAPTKKDEEEAKIIEDDDTDDDDDDTPDENVVISSTTKKKVGRPQKYFTKEEVKKVDVTKKQASAWHVNAMKKTGRKFSRPEGKQLKAGTFDGDDTSQATYTAHMKKQQDALTARLAKKASKGSGLCEECKHKETSYDCYSRGECEEQYSTEAKEMEGGFLFDKKSRSKIAKSFKKVVTKPVGKIIKSIGKTITKAPAAIQDVAEEVGERAVNVGKKIMYESHSFPADMKTLLNKFGHEGITSAVLKRSPVSGLVSGALNVFSLGEFSKRMKPFDDLFHLWIEFRLERGGEMRLEKNARITLTKLSGAKDHKDTQVQPIEEAELPSDLNLDLILDRTRNYMGDKKFFQYNSSNNNCQDFITAILISNKIGDAQDRVWVKQDTEHLFKDMPGLRKIANTATQLGARLENIGDAIMGGSIGDGLCDSCRHSNTCETCISGGALGDDPNKPPKTPGGTPRRQHTGPNPPPPPPPFLPPTPPPLPLPFPIPFMPIIQPTAAQQAINHQNVIPPMMPMLQAAAPMGFNFLGAPQPLQAQNQTPVALPQPPAQETPPTTPPQQIPPGEWNYDSPTEGEGFSGLGDKGGYGSQGAGMLNTYIGNIKMTAGRNTREEYSAVNALNRMYGTGIETHTMPDGTEMPGRTHMEGGELSITSLIRGIRRGDDKKPATHTRQGQKITSMKGRGVDEEDDIDFDDIKWGSFTAMFKRFKKQNPHQKKVKDLKAFAKMIQRGESKFSKKALQKANFYLNVIL